MEWCGLLIVRPPEESRLAAVNPLKRPFCRSHRRGSETSPVRCLGMLKEAVVAPDCTRAGVESF